MCVNKLRVLLLCVILCVLCGCTRREQLTLEVKDAAEAADETKQVKGESQPAGYAAQESAQTLPGEELAEGSGRDTADMSAAVIPEQEVSGQPKAGGAERTEQELCLPDETDVICVHVCGAVKRAGVYELPAGSRVYEAVKKAGGFAEEADEDYVNQAQQLSDGSKLVIPTIEQVQGVEAGGESAGVQIGIVEQEDIALSAGYGKNAEEDGSPDGRININTASEAQLCGIPGIGATRAAAIVAYRQDAGGFRSIEDIMNVSGIKEGTFAKIKDKIKVD